MYSIFFIAGVSWVAVLYQLFNIDPTGLWARLAFLFSLSLALVMTLSIPLFLLRKKVNKTVEEYTKDYRKCFKVSLSMTISIVGILALRAFSVGTPLNIVLLLLVTTLIGFKISK